MVPKTDQIKPLARAGMEPLQRLRYPRSCRSHYIK